MFLTLFFENNKCFSLFYFLTNHFFCSKIKWGSAVQRAQLFSAGNIPEIDSPKIPRGCNGAPIGGLKVMTESGWFAARPSGTENIYKIYAESFRRDDHLRRILEEAQAIVNDALIERISKSADPVNP